MPELVWQLNELRLLYVNDNQLDSISPEIAKLTKLSVLLLDNNQLETIPAQLADLPISVFYATGNKLLYPPQEVADKASGGIDEFKILKQWFADNPSATNSSDNSQLNLP